MITISRLTEKNLEIFKDKKIIIYGHNGYSMALYNLFKFKKINVLAICDKKINKTIKQQFRRIRIMDSTDLMDLKDVDNIIIQLAEVNPDYAGDIKKLSDDIDAEISPFLFGELMFSFNHLYLFSKCKNKIWYIYKYLRFFKSTKSKKNSEFALWIKDKDEDQEAVIVCAPPKTGDHTLNYTFDYLRNQTYKNFHYINLFHKPRCINKSVWQNNLNKIKVITAVREPIAQNLSMYFHTVGASIFDIQLLIGDYECNNFYLHNKTIKKYEDLSIKSGEDIQKLWNMFIYRYVYSDTRKGSISHIDYSIQRFEKEFSKHVVDITKYPFDKEQGFTIIQEGNIEVFVYQLEKLNDLVPVLSQWVGVPFTELVRGNDSSNKWIANSYKQAQKEIEITQEYFERCYNEPYVQHCYSQEDIAKFKERWSPHIK